MNKYDEAVYETQSVLGEWMSKWMIGAGGPWSVDLGKEIVDRLVAKGLLNHLVQKEAS